MKKCPNMKNFVQSIELRLFFRFVFLFHGNFGSDGVFFMEMCGGRGGKMFEASNSKSHTHKYTHGLFNQEEEKSHQQHQKEEEEEEKDSIIVCVHSSFFGFSKIEKLVKKFSFCSFACLFFHKHTDTQSHTHTLRYTNLFYCSFFFLLLFLRDFPFKIQKLQKHKNKEEN